MNTSFAKADIVKIPKDSAAAVLRGHPWVYGPLASLEVGSLLRLTDPRGKFVGFGLADEGSIRVRVLGRGSAPDRTLQSLLEERITRADAVRFRVVAGQTNAWRVVNGAGDGLPGLIIDRYADIAVIKLYSLAWVPYLDEIKRVVAGLPWVTGVLRRLGVRRVDGSKGSRVLSGHVPDTVMVEEHGMRLLARPYDGQKTGLFLDQREHRFLVRHWAAGRRTANLFAYNGGFSVAAALGGASEVFTVDIAAAAIEDAKENFRINDLNPDHYSFEVADAFAWRPRGKLGMLIVDPPSLARGGRSRGAAARAYQKLHAGLADALVRDGLLGSSSCTAQLTFDSWQSAIQQGLAGGGSWSLLHRSEAPPDHPVALAHTEGRYLKFALLRFLDS